MYYKLNAFGDSKRKVTQVDNMKLSMVYKTETDSVFLNTQNQNLTGKIILSAKEATSMGMLGNGLLDMSEGDSVTFVLEAANVFENFLHTPIPLFLNKKSMIKVEVKLNAVLDKKELRSELEKYDEALAIWDVEEQRLIQQYIKSNSLNALQLSNGMYYIQLAEGRGLQADSGKTVQVNYTGYFLGGHKFDSTKDKLPFEFIIGEEFQVIWGLQQGIKRMKEGEKAKFIIPSYLAFGGRGSSTGIVPPHTTLMYEVELIKVK